MFASNERVIDRVQFGLEIEDPSDTICVNDRSAAGDHGDDHSFIIRIRGANSYDVERIAAMLCHRRCAYSSEDDCTMGIPYFPNLLCFDVFR